MHIYIYTYADAIPTDFFHAECSLFLNYSFPSLIGKWCLPPMGFSIARVPRVLLDQRLVPLEPIKLKVKEESNTRLSRGERNWFSQKLPWMIIFLHKLPGKWFKKMIWRKWYGIFVSAAGFKWRLRFQRPRPPPGASAPAGLDCGPGLASGTATASGASGAVGVVGLAAAEAGALATTLEMSISRFQWNLERKIQPENLRQLCEVRWLLLLLLIQLSQELSAEFPGWN